MHPIDTAPKDGTVINVTQERLYRWLPYKPNSQQVKQGIQGRWQTPNEYGGWDNAELYGLGWLPADETGEGG